VKRILTISAIILVIAFGSTLLYFKGKRYEVVITQNQIDASLSERFPVTKNYLLIFSLTYDNPQVSLLENEDRIQVGMDATLNIKINGEPSVTIMKRKSSFLMMLSSTDSRSKGFLKNGWTKLLNSQLRQPANPSKLSLYIS
jgi:hypothetical protein